MSAALQAKAEARDLDADLAICEAATPGPWAVCDKYVVQDRYDRDDYRQGIFKPQHIPKFEDDMKFAAAARTGWPYAIRRAQEAERENDRLRNELNILQEQQGRGGYE